MRLPLGDTQKEEVMNTVQTNLPSFSDSIVDGTTDREAHPKRWIAALVQSCTEKRVGTRLDKLEVENYIPTQTEIHQWSDRKKKIERIVIPMIVFIHTDEMTERRLRMQTYIRKILSYPGQWKAAVIPDDQIDRLKFMLRHAETSVELLEQSLQVGETVRVVRGPLKGLEGEICMAKDDKPMVAIRIDCLGYACVNIEKSDVEIINHNS